jgi:glucose 1-dehydrogenase
VTSNIIETPTDVEPAGAHDSVGPSFRTEPSEWLSLLEVLTKPAALIDELLAELDRVQRGIRQPRRGAVVGTNMLGLVATLVLRMRGAEVVTIGSLPEPLLSPNRIKGVAGWKHLWMNPALASIPLLQETGARYVCASELSTERLIQRFGPFDVTIVSSAGLAPVPGLTRRLAETGALVDLARNGMVEIWTAAPTSSFRVKHQATFRYGGDDRIHSQRATRNLALAEALYPGWLARLMNSLEAPQCRSSASTGGECGILERQQIQDREGKECELF